MTTPYFESAEDAAAALGIPLLIAASAESAVPRAASKLSDLAVETMLGGRLYNRLRIPDMRGGQVVWVCAPYGSQESIAWAIAIAEHAAGFGRSAFLLDAGVERRLGSLTAGRGLELPDVVQDRIEVLGLGPAVGWASDLAGVRIVLPSGEAPAGSIPPNPVRWTLVVARSMPDPSGEVPSALASGIDGIVLVAAIRDHTRDELTGFGNALRSLNVPLFGLIALGPVPRPKQTPLERWNRVDVRVGAGPEEEDAAIGRAPSVVEPLKGVEPETEPIALGLPWQGPRRNRTWLWIVLIVALAGTMAGTGYLRGWWGGPAAPPVEPLQSGLPIAMPADSSAETRPNTVPDTAAVLSAATDSGAVGPAVADSSAAAVVISVPDSTGVSAMTAAGWPDTFVVHVNSFNHATFAEREVERLRGHGLVGSVVAVELPNRGRWYRVVVGSFPDSAQAAAEATLLRERQLVSFAQVLDKGGQGKPQRAALQ